MADEIKTRITVEADEAVRNLDDVTKAEAQMAGATEEAGQATEETTEKLSLQQRAVNGTTEAVQGMVMRWASFTAVAGLIIKFFKELYDVATQAARAIADVGAGLGGLAVNIGGADADKVHEAATRIARERRLGVQGRAELIQAASTITDLRDMKGKPEEVIAFIENSAKLQHGSEVGGEQNARIIQALSRNLGKSDEEAVEMAMVMLTGGMEAQSIITQAQRMGNLPGGDKLMSLVFASGRHGLGVNESGRRANTLVDALTMRDESGELNKLLTGAGVTEEMGMVDRLMALEEALASGRITQGHYEKAVGGARIVAELITPMKRAIESGDYEAVQAAMRDPDTSARAIQERQASRYRSAFERQQDRELRKKVASEEAAALGGIGEEIQEVITDTAEQGGGSWFLGTLKELALSGGSSTASSVRYAERRAQRRAAEAQGEGQRPIVVEQNININSGNFYDTPDWRTEARDAEEMD